jgi:thiol-disulfide isomerase/thioredoxin
MKKSINLKKRLKMKKSCFMTMIAVLCLAACTPTSTKTEITITGELGDPNLFYFRALGTDDTIPGVLSVKDNVVTFEVDTVDNIFVLVERHDRSRFAPPLSVVIADGTPVEVVLKDGFGSITKGSEQNIKMGEAYKTNVDMKAKEEELNDEFELNALVDKYGDDIPQEVYSAQEERERAFKEEEKETYRKIVLENADNMVPIYFLSRYRGKLGAEFVGKFLADYKYKDSKMFEPFYRPIVIMAREYCGIPYVDCTGKDLQGNRSCLTDYVGRGKYVLVNFWASWCGSCRAEIPNIKANYEKYKEKGLEVVGISLDTKQEEWEKCVQEMGITWPQISELKGWDSYACMTFNIWKIPQTFLYGPDGKVVAGGLEGKALEKKLAEIFE